MVSLVVIVRPVINHNSFAEAFTALAMRLVLTIYVRTLVKAPPLIK